MLVEEHPIFQRPTVSLDVPERVLLCRDNGSKIILYQDDMIRWCYSSSKVTYGSLLLDPPVSDVIDVVTDESGTYTCVYNHDQIKIVEVPWNLWNGNDEKEIQNLSTSIQRALQEKVYSFSNMNVTIKQAAFHPLSSGNPCLVVLFDNSEIALIDLKSVLNTESIPSSCFLNVSIDGVMGMSSRVDNIQHISFSGDGLSLYCITDTDIYSFYPMLPPVATFTEAQVETLMYKSIVLYDSLNKDSEDAVKRNIIKQVQFISKLHENITHRKNKSVKDKESSMDKVYNISIDPEFRQTKAQGYFSITPFPKEIYDSIGLQFLILPIGNSNELFIAAYDDGTILILFKDMESSMSWDVNEYSYNNSFVLVEIIELKPEELSKIIVFSEIEGKFAVLGTNSSKIIDTTSWSSVVSQCIQDNDLRPISVIEIQSKITTLPFEKAVTSCGIWNLEKNTSLLLVADKQVSNSSVFRKQVSATEYEKQEAKKNVLNIDGIPHFKFNQPISEIMALNQKFKDSCRVPYSKVIPVEVRKEPLANGHNEEQLAVLTNVSEEIGNKILQGQALGLILHNRLNEQQNTLSEELLASNKIIVRIKKVQIVLDYQQSKLADKLIKQQELMARFAKLNEKLQSIKDTSEYKNSELTTKEIQFFKEIRDQVYMFNGFVREQQLQREAIVFLKKELGRVSELNRNNLPRKVDEWDELRNILQTDAKIIQECNNQLSKVAIELDNIDNTII